MKKAIVKILENIPHTRACEVPAWDDHFTIIPQEVEVTMEGKVEVKAIYHNKNKPALFGGVAVSQKPNVDEETTIELTRFDISRFIHKGLASSESKLNVIRTVYDLNLTRELPLGNLTTVNYLEANGEIIGKEDELYERFNQKRDHMSLCRGNKVNDWIEEQFDSPLVIFTSDYSEFKGSPADLRIKAVSDAKHELWLAEEKYKAVKRTAEREQSLAEMRAKRKVS